MYIFEGSFRVYFLMAYDEVKSFPFFAQTSPPFHTEGYWVQRNVKASYDNWLIKSQALYRQ